MPSESLTRSIAAAPSASPSMVAATDPDATTHRTVALATGPQVVRTMTSTARDRSVPGAPTWPSPVTSSKDRTVVSRSSAPCTVWTPVIATQSPASYQTCSAMLSPCREVDRGAGGGHGVADQLGGHGLVGLVGVDVEPPGAARDPVTVGGDVEGGAPDGGQLSRVGGHVPAAEAVNCTVAPGSGVPLLETRTCSGSGSGWPGMASWPSPPTRERARGRALNWVRWANRCRQSVVRQVPSSRRSSRAIGA